MGSECESNPHYEFYLNFAGEIFIYLFRFRVCFEGVIHPFDLLSPSIFGFRVLNTKQCILANGARPFLPVVHSVCSKGGEIIPGDIKVLQGNHVQTVDASLQRNCAWPVRRVCN